MVQRRITTLAVALCATALAPAAASAATTLGPSPLPTPNSSITFGSCCVATYVITAHPGATLEAPGRGVITRWRVHESNGQPGVMKPRVLRAAGGASYTGVATGAEVPVGTSSTLKTYATRLPIGAGELFGVDANTGPNVQLAGASLRLGLPAIANGATGSLTNLWNDRALAVNADMEPDADGDGFGDETQDLSLGAAARAADTELGRIGSASTVQMTNRESSPVTIDTVRIDGPARDDFFVTEDECAGTTLQPGESCAVRVRFAPTAAGDRAATLAVRSTADPLGQVLDGTDVALAGTGFAPAAPQTTASASPHLVSILLADRLSVRRGRRLGTTVFSTSAGRATVRLLRGSTVVSTFEQDINQGKTRLRLPTRRLRAGRYAVQLLVSGAGQTSSDTARLMVRKAG